MQKILNIYKPKGLTPLQTIHLLRKKFPEYKDQTIGFAGRLDPLAHGVLLLMIGEETTKEKDKYLNLPKEYEFEVVFGVATDTYDALGLLQNNKSMKRSSNNLQAEIEDFIKQKIGKQTQTYPPYSSKTVMGKPLYLWARENKLSEITIPEREIKIFTFTLLGIDSLSTEKLKSEVIKQIDLVNGDFRQKEIKEMWNTFLDTTKMQTFITARFRIECSSGTYVRSLINALGKKTGSGAIALDILRTKAGIYSVTDSQHLT